MLGKKMSSNGLGQGNCSYNKSVVEKRSFVQHEV